MILTLLVLIERALEGETSAAGVTLVWLLSLVNENVSAEIGGGVEGLLAEGTLISTVVVVYHQVSSKGIPRHVRFATPHKGAPVNGLSVSE